MICEKKIKVYGSFSVEGGGGAAGRVISSYLFRYPMYSHTVRYLCIGRGPLSRLNTSKNDLLIFPHFRICQNLLITHIFSLYPPHHPPNFFLFYPVFPCFSHSPSFSISPKITSTNIPPRTGIF
jgi:hypothetical protein